jgi:uncharacterized membrane protein
MTNLNEESIMKKYSLVLMAVLAVSVSGCANMSSGEQRTLSGAGIGAAAGALVGELAVGRPMAGAAWGAAAGAAGGYLYDRHEKSQ